MSYSFVLPDHHCHILMLHIRILRLSSYPRPARLYSLGRDEIHIDSHSTRNKLTNLRWRPRSRLMKRLRNWRMPRNFQRQVRGKCYAFPLPELLCVLISLVKTKSNDILDRELYVWGWRTSRFSCQTLACQASGKISEAEALIDRCGGQSRFLVGMRQFRVNPNNESWWCNNWNGQIWVMKYSDATCIWYETGALRTQRGQRFLCQHAIDFLWQARASAWEKAAASAKQMCAQVGAQTFFWFILKAITKWRPPKRWRSDWSRVRNLRASLEALLQKKQNGVYMLSEKKM